MTAYTPQCAEYVNHERCTHPAAYLLIAGPLCVPGCELDSGPAPGGYDCADHARAVLNDYWDHAGIYWTAEALDGGAMLLPDNAPRS